MLPSYIPRKRDSFDSDVSNELPEPISARRAATIRILGRLTVSALVYFLWNASHREALLARIKSTMNRNPLAGIDPAYLDITRSFKHKVMLRPSVTYELNTLDATGFFPEWYGQPTQAGPSPFDYALPEEWRKSTRWHFALPEPQDPALEELNELAKAIQGSTPAFTVSAGSQYQPLRNWLGLPLRPDVLVTTGNAKPCGLSSRTKHVHILNECIGRNCTRQLDMQNGQISLARHGYEMSDILAWHKLEEDYGAFPMQLFAHLPYSADPDTYFPAKEKPSGVPRILDVDAILGQKQLPNAVPDAAAYRNATFCIFSSEPKRRMSREWVKAMLSGCVIVSDMPTESEEALEHFILSYPTGSDTATIGALVEEAARNPARLRRQALHAFIYARQHFTSLHQVGRILQLVEQYKAGVRGYDFTMPVSLKCRQYEDGYRPGWC